MLGARYVTDPDKPPDAWHRFFLDQVKMEDIAARRLHLAFTLTVLQRKGHHA